MESILNIVRIKVSRLTGPLSQSILSLSLGSPVAYNQHQSQRPTSKLMGGYNSAGTPAQLFGDRRTILVLDLSVSGGVEVFDTRRKSGSDSSNVSSPASTNSNSSSTSTSSSLSSLGMEGVSWLNNGVKEESSQFALLLRHLRQFHSPPECLLCYASIKDAALRAMVERRMGHITHLVLLAPSWMDGHEVEGIVGHFASLNPCCPTEKAKAVRPQIILLNGASEKVAGVDVHFPYADDKAEELAGKIGDFLHGTTHPPSLRDAMSRSGIHCLEETRANRNALSDPFWVARLVDECFEHIPPPAAIGSDDDRFPSLSSDALKKLNDAIDSWDFYAPSLSRIECFHVILLIFRRLDLLEVLEVDEDKFKEFILVIEHNYHPNPYHNFFHAVDVLQCCYFLLNSSMMLRRLFKHSDCFALLIAALCHDLGHTSFNNPFTVEHESLLAWLYNDRAVLENMHAATLFAILRHPKYNFCHSWPRSQWKEFRTLVLSSILGTDMSQHFDYIRQLTGIDGAFNRSLKCLNNAEGPVPLEDRRLLLIAIIKFADICNVVRPFEWARRWGFHLVCEFFHQGDWEKALGYASTPMSTRNVGDLAKGQLYFLNNVAGPLFRCMSEHFSELSFAEDQLKANMEAWRNWRADSDDIIHTYAELYSPSDREHRHRSH